MATQIGAIQPRQVNFRIQGNADWLDGLLVWQAQAGGTIAGAENVGNGTANVLDVDPATALGSHTVSVSSVANGLTYLAVSDPSGAVTGRGTVGLPLYAGGLTLQVAAGSIAFAAGDAFAVGALPGPIDITGLRFVLQVRTAKTSAVVLLEADSAPPIGNPMIATGGSAGSIAMAVPQTVLSASRLAQSGPGLYYYDIIAVDVVSGRKVDAFYGTLRFDNGVTLIRA
jgi:hypothetical protein